MIFFEPYGTFGMDKISEKSNVFVILKCALLVYMDEVIFSFAYDVIKIDVLKLFRALYVLSYLVRLMQENKSY